MWKSRILQFTFKMLIKLLNYDIIWNLSVDSNHCIDSFVDNYLIILNLKCRGL